MNLTEIFAFFDKQKPCPESVKNCADLREKYNAEISNLGPNCPECQLISIRDKYIKILLEK